MQTSSTPTNSHYAANLKWRSTNKEHYNSYANEYMKANYQTKYAAKQKLCSSKHYYFKKALKELRNCLLPEL